MKNLNLALLGPGLVGGELLRQIQEYNAKKKNTPLQLIAIASSKRFVVQATPLPLEEAQWKPLLQDEKVSQSHDLKAFTQKLLDLGHHVGSVVIIDCTTSQDVADYYLEWKKIGFHIVAANKKAFSGTYGSFVKLKAPGPSFMLHEATVGAGLPIIRTLEDMIETGDRILRIEGIFSGTLSYLFNRYSPASSIPTDNLSFSALVNEAKTLGYTEPDPRDDLNGLDMARKVLILARICGKEISLEDLPVQNIVPAGLRDFSLEQFLQNKKQMDTEMDPLKQSATHAQQVLRYVGTIDMTPDGRTSVELCRYPYNHPFANLKGSDNIISFVTERYPNGLVIQGSGAGAAVTAGGVLADILCILSAATKQFTKKI